MAEVIEIDINAIDNTSRAANSARMNFQKLGREISGIGQSMTNIFTRPIMQMSSFIMKNKEVQEAMKPINEAFTKVGEKLATSFIPVIERLTPALLSLADSLSKIIDWFAKLPPGVQDSVVAFAGIIAAVGPVLTTIGSLITAFGTVATFFTTGAGAGFGTAVAGVFATITAPVWLLIGAIGLLGVTIAVFGKQAWQTVTDIGKIFQAIWTLIQIKIDQIKQAWLSVDWGGIGRNIINAVINGIRSVSIVGVIGSIAGSITKRASGGPASGLTLVGERGPELVSLPQGSYVNSNSASRGMLSGGSVSLVYSPMFSMGDRESLQTALEPLFNEWKRKQR
ncbi:MAG: hypothetical protein GYA36_17940 [Veillonellaceae bacterium]|nr:hypothetical protein [Veillonellaceae bacterium]